MRYIIPLFLMMLTFTSPVKALETFGLDTKELERISEEANEIFQNSFEETAGDIINEDNEKTDADNNQSALDELDNILNGTKGTSQKKVRKTRNVLQERSTVNGIQGRYMPKKVWGDDIDNEAGITALRNGSNKALSGAARGQIPAPQKTWGN